MRRRPVAGKNGGATTPSQTEQSKDVVKRYFEEGLPRYRAGDRQALGEYFAHYFVQHTASHHKHGKQSLDDRQASIDETFKAIPDARTTVDRLLAEGDYVAAHWRIEGTYSGRHTHRHAGSLEGRGERVEINGLTLYRVQDGKIAEAWGYDNHLDILIDMGALKAAT